MHSQPAVVFKRKGSTVAIMGVPPFFLLVLGLVSLFPGARGFLPAGVVLIVLALTCFYLLWRTATQPYLHLTDNQVTVYRGFFQSPIHYSLSDIDGAHTNRPETYIELLGGRSAGPIRINLNPLDKSDRIRFIFLVESSINRKFSHQQTPVRESAG
jgi:hypothetical protein